MKKQIVLAVMVVLILITVTGCIGYNEETWLKKNGSGKIFFELSVPGLAEDNVLSEEGLAESFAKTKGIKLLEAKSYHDNGNKVVQATIAFDSLKALNEHKEAFWGEISLEKGKRGQLLFTKVISLGTNEKTAGFSEAASMLQGYQWKYTVHFPYKVSDANTAERLIDTKKNTVTWEVSLAGLASGSRELKATLKTTNYWLYGAIVLVIVAAVLSGVLLWAFKTVKPKENTDTSVAE